MCGRFALYSSIDKIVSVFNVNETITYTPSFNIAPSQNILTIYQLPDNQRALTYMQWGLIPSWAKDTKKFGFINAKLETIKTKPSFRNAFKKRRCLIPADGFYEWHENKNNVKQPYYIHRQDKTPFAFAGMWEKYQKNNTVIVSCCIVTRPANQLIAKVHARMPLILAEASYEDWLNNENLSNDFESQLSVLSSTELELYPVSRAVNKPSVNNRSCVEPLND